MVSSKAYRQHAEDCLRLAQIVTTAGEREALVAMAQAWHALAQEQESREQDDQSSKDAAA
jgi:hypothetical protein